MSRRLGFVAETTRLYPELRVRRLLAFVAGARGLAPAEGAERVDEGLARFGLATVADRPVGHLSKGFQQRVNLAQAFLHDPPLVLVDEPTSGLDPLQQAEVRRMLRALRGAAHAGALHPRPRRGARAHRARRGAPPRAARRARADARRCSGGDPLALFRGEGRAA